MTRIPLRRILNKGAFQLVPGGRTFLRERSGATTIPDGCNGTWISMDLSTEVIPVTLHSQAGECPLRHSGPAN